VARPEVASALQWNLHSWAQFQVDEAERSFLVEREGSSLAGHVMYHHNGFFSLSEGWDPAPFRTKPDAQWRQQYHLRFTCSGMSERRSLGVVLCPGHAGLRRAEVRCERVTGAEVARVGEDTVLVSQGTVIEHGGVQSDALALMVLGGRRYEAREEGVRVAYTHTPSGLNRRPILPITGRGSSRGRHVCRGAGDRRATSGVAVPYWPRSQAAP